MTKEEIMNKMKEAETTSLPADENSEVKVEELGEDADYKALYEAALKDKAEIEKNAKSALIQKSKYKEILENIAGEIKEPVKKDDSANNVVTKEEVKIEIFKIKHPDLSEDDVTTLSQFARATGKTLEQTLETPVFKSYIEKINTEKGINNAIPNFKSRSNVGAGAEAKDKQFQEHIISKMPQHLQKYFNKDKK